MGVALDGGMICIVGEGWKELKAGCVFEVETRDSAVGDQRDVERHAHAVNLSYVAHLGAPDPLGWQLWTEAQRRGWETASDWIVVGDAAAWIWRLRAEHFPGSYMVVDWYHATEHLGESKQLLFAEDSRAGNRWYNTQELLLYQGHANRVAQQITDTAVSFPQATRTAAAQHAHYFSHHQRRMQYLSLRNDGWVIGSGMIESGIKRFQARFDAAGMRWSRAGAENLLPVRAAVLSGEARFDSLWQRAYAA
jgi:hypothetical protein